MTAKRPMDIVVLDPKRLGARTHVRRLWKVEDGRQVCFIFDESKYGIYCLEHGRSGCDAVREIIALDEGEKSK